MVDDAVRRRPLRGGPFGDQPTVVYAGGEEPVAGKHFVGEVAFGYGLLITPSGYDRPEPGLSGVR